MAKGLPVGGFIAIVFVILLINVGVVFGYYKFLEKNLVVPKLAPELLAPLRWAMVGLIALSWIFSVACTAACTFLTLEYTQTLSNYLGGMAGLYGGGVVEQTVTEEESVGFQCIAGPNDQGQGGMVGQGDSRVDAAYAFAVINNLLTTAVLAGIVLVQLSSLGVVRPKALQDETFAGKAWRAMGFLALASTWCCIFTFYVQQTPVCLEYEGYISCSLGGAGIAQAFNAIFLIGICCLFFVVPPPPASGGGGADDATGGDDGDEKKEAAEDGGDEEDPTEAPEASTTAKDDAEGDGEKATPAKDSEDLSS